MILESGKYVNFEGFLTALLAFDYDETAFKTKTGDRIEAGGYDRPRHRRGQTGGQSDCLDPGQTACPGSHQLSGLPERSREDCERDGGPGGEGPGDRCQYCQGKRCGPSDQKGEQ